MDSNILGPEWNLSPDGINLVSENGTLKDKKKLLENALNLDLKSIGKPVLASVLSKSRIEKIVLQIQKIRNVSAPKAKENSQLAPRMLKLTLTDGESYVQAIEISVINSISRENTAPGTKILIIDANLVSGYLLINSQNCKVLGGRVEHLYEKWLLAKSVQQNHQYVSSDGAPPWVAFGCKISTGNEDKTFKSLDKSKDPNSNSEFEQQRKDAIAEASTGAIKKTFGGRVKQNVQATQNTQQQYRGKGRPDRPEQPDRGRKGKFAQKEEDGGFEKFQKPSEKISLFSFLEDKLPITETKKDTYTKPVFNQETKSKPYSERSTNQNYNNNQPYKKYEHGKPEQSNNSFNYNRGDSSYNNRTTGNRPDSYQGNRPRNDRSQLQPPVQNRVQNQGSYSANSTTSRQQYYDNQKPTQNVSQNSANVQNNVDMHNLAANLSKMSVNNEFASRSLKQHLNLAGPVKKQEANAVPNGPSNDLRIGDRCMARYWEDGKLYNAIITAVTEKTYAVQFTGYGNIEEVLKHDCFSPFDGKNQQFRGQNSSTNNFSGMPTEFRRRGPPRK
ncbi:tudor domain-containing protein 3-like [Sitophilus oryzae]|uniref:Survival of motor neuron-related-splicing factor 30 n=1 Tax=Sitophilus oryzae TaxID=7048 RepID=A0A6J2X335_SITOR|nr:tudor domain-containing protein 3-like [Sitophilus oryzae]